MPGTRLTSLLLVEERLLEADYFVRRLRRSGPHNLSANLNAFLSAARSTTFLLQKEMARVPGFRTWWAKKQDELRQDAAAKFFVDLRNFSQKEGRVPTIGFRADAGRGRWSYRFVGRADPTPFGLYDRDIAQCCADHVAKLAQLALDFAGVFPFYSCHHRALTIDGVAGLGLSLPDIAAAADLPEDWFDVPPQSSRCSSQAYALWWMR
jgi:hypothetical protein